MSTYYFLPTRNVFGEGAVNEIGTLMGCLNVSHSMIVTDKFLAQSGMAASIQEILSGSSIRSVVFDGAEPNPTDKNVEAGVAFSRKTTVTPSSPWAAAPPMTVPRVSAW